MNNVKLVSTKGTEFVLEKKAAAFVNSRKCVNCGTCREACPVGAIKEYQRPVCHTCPLCGDTPTISPNEVDALATEKSCTTGCPLGIAPQGYVNLVKAGKSEEAFKIIWDKNPLPSVCGSICHHPCEDNCKRGILVDKPIDIRGIKKYLSNKVEYKQEKYPRIYDEKIAIIGAGPAGLTAGHYLSKEGYEVTIFESSTEAGGMLKRGIPEFRLDRAAIDRDIDRLVEAGLDIRLQQRVDKLTLAEIKEEYDAVIVAAGTPIGKELTIENWRYSGIFTALNFMEFVNHNQTVRRHIGQIFNFEGGEAVIIGGGSVAMDAARAALRVGASKVTAVCLESGENVPAHPWEIEEAKEEGIEVIEGYSPIKYEADCYPTITGVKCAKVKNFKKDEKGRITFDKDENDIITIKADWVVVAIGQAPESYWLEASDEKTFYAGDITRGKCSVVDGMASGRKTALEVDAVLRGRALKDPMADHDLTLAPMMEKIYPYNRRKINRPQVETAAVEYRIKNFNEVEGIFTDKQVMEEVNSCLACGYEVVDQDKCIGCGICQKLCPKGDVITMVSID